jgi:2-oxoglutarate/2-oxoacid ferredoxin oxidoreductase subunit beta
MFGLNGQCPLLEVDREYYTLDDYAGSTPRWCPGCGDNAILTAVQKLCRDEQLPPEKTVFVSGIGCSSRFPHYMSTYGFHGLHGRALPIAQGIKIRRPDLHVFVNTGDGDCASIGTAHWIHAIRYNMNMTVMLHDNSIYGMTKFQASPTTPHGMKTNTTPYGSPLRPLNILSATLGVSNASFVANVVEWAPELLYQVIKLAYHHKGFSFVRIIQRCPHFVPNLFDPLIKDPDNLMLLTHARGMQVSEQLSKIYKRQFEHDPADLDAGRALASRQGEEPIGILYHDPDVPCYEDLVRPARVVTPEMRREAVERELDKFAVHVD